MESFDVVILGAGIAGGCLARQLSLELPELKVLQLEKSETFSYKVGESSVEVAGFYFQRVLELSQYLQRNHLNKNGLRFFFDSPEADMSLYDMSEIGTIRFPTHQAFQLNRARLERDLIEMNRGRGIDVRLGAKVESIELAQAGGKHVITYTQADAVSRSIECTWLVDASGRRQLLGRQLDLRREVPELPTCATWGRFRNVKDLDSLPNEAWRRRANFTPRFLSTNHFMYKGYWFWFIPISDDLTSIGVVIDKKIHPSFPSKRQAFLDFCARHRAVWELMGDAEMVDFVHLNTLAHKSEHYFSERRWAVIGDAGAFHDPLVSLGTTLIAHQNTSTVAMIRADLVQHCGPQELARSVALFDTFIQKVFAGMIESFGSGLYRGFGCWEIWAYKHMFDYHIALNFFIWAFMWGYTRSPDRLRSFLSHLPPHFDQVISRFQRLFIDVHDVLEARGVDYRFNRGNFLTAADNFGFEDMLNQADPLEIVELRTQLHLNMCRVVFAWAVESVLEISGFATRQLIQDEVTFEAIASNDQIARTSLQPLVDRAAAQLLEQLRVRWPAASIRELSISLDDLDGDLEALQGDFGSESERDEALAFANEQWNAPFESVLHAIFKPRARHTAREPQIVDQPALESSISG